MPRIPGPRSPLALLRFLRSANADSYRALTDLHEEYGDVVEIGFGPGLMVVMFGREANEYILSTNPGAFRWREAMKALIPVDGETALVVSDGPDHDRRRRLVQPGFHKRRIDGYLDLMSSEADRVIDAVHVGDRVDAYELFRAAIRRTVVLALFGEHLRARADEIGDTLQPAFDFINLPPQKQVKLPWPGTKYHRARTARAEVDAIIDAEIDRRRGRPEQDDGADVLTMLLGARDEDGTGLTPQEVRDQVVSLIAAGYDTTSAGMAWAVHRLVTETGVWERARQELDAVVGDDRITIDDLPKLPYLDGVVQETLRMHPPGVVAPRKVVEPIEFGGHRIRKGALVLYSAYLTGRDPACWPAPDAFRPERWDKSTPDYVEPPPYAFVPFGGGSRRCIGFAFATLELKMMVAQMVRRLELRSTATAPPTPTGIASVMPAGGVPVEVIAVHPSARGHDTRARAPSPVRSLGVSARAASDAAQP